MKAAIVYYSKHHGNTKKLLDAIAQAYDVDLIDVSNTKVFDLFEYEVIGFASGIYINKIYMNAIKSIVKAKHAEILGEYECFGFDTFGPLKLLGGIRKGHPTVEEMNRAVEFYTGIVNK